MYKFLPFLLLTYFSQAQDSTSSIRYLERNVWRVDFLGPGVSNERSIGQKTTIVSRLGFVSSPAFIETVTSSRGQVESSGGFAFSPRLSIAGRHFYNFNRRIQKGKSIRYNSGNYISAKALYTFSSISNCECDGPTIRPNDIQGFALQALWGFQRTYRKNFYLNLELGLSTRSTLINVGANPLLTSEAYFTLGYTFPSRHK